MVRRKILFSIVLIFIILLNPLTLLANTISTYSYEEVYNMGYYRGYDAGRNLALKNNANKKYYTYEQISKPDEKSVLKEYSDYLKDKSQFKSTFYTAYLQGFEKGYRDYIWIYSAPSGGSSNVNISSEFGVFFGQVYGEISGLKDYEDGKSPNYLRMLPKDSEITSKFELSLFPAIDRSNFIKQFKDYFRKGYEEAYYNAHYGTNKNSVESGREDGAFFGEKFGNIFGAKDYFEGRNLDYNRNLPTDNQIKLEYSLNRHNEEYTKGFIDGFKNAFKEAYITSFREAKNNIKLLEDSYGYENGYEVGEARGIIQGRIDYINGMTNNWMRSKPLYSTISNDYKLMYQSKNYMDSFINGFLEGYSKGYTDIYKELSQENALNKITSINVPITGGIFQSLDKSLTVEIEKGTYYKPIILNINILNDFYNIDKRYISAAKYYRVNTINPTMEFNKDKKIQISFEYYGDYSGGIYILKDDKWEYLNSTIRGNKISTFISPSILDYQGSIFTVLVDKEIESFYDIRGHWAKDEINTFIRRGIINGYTDKTFRPDSYITRAEFLVLLSRVYNWKLSDDISNLSIFKDRDSFNIYNEKQISYGIRHGYINGYSDNNFNPYNNITYKEVEAIMRRVLKNSDFTWDYFADRMLYERKIRCSSKDSMDNKITRAEIIFLLYQINE